MNKILSILLLALTFSNVNVSAAAPQPAKAQHARKKGFFKRHKTKLIIASAILAAVAAAGITIYVFRENDTVKVVLDSIGSGLNTAKNGILAAPGVTWEAMKEHPYISVAAGTGIVLTTAIIIDLCRDNKSLIKKFIQSEADKCKSKALPRKLKDEPAALDKTAIPQQA